MREGSIIKIITNSLLQCYDNILDKRTRNYGIIPLEGVIQTGNMKNITLKTHLKQMRKTAKYHTLHLNV